jgi:hypothetical protein
MRGIVLIVGLLAATKVGYQEYAERSALTEVLLNTYRQDATESCRREAQQRNFRMPDWAWSAPKDIHISIGRSGDSEPYWQLGSALMSTAPRDPFVVLVADKDPFEIVCDYDIVRQLATINRL